VPHSRQYRRSYREALAFLSEIKLDIDLVNYGDSVPPLRARPQTFFPRRGLIRSCNYAPHDIPTLAFDADFRALGLIVIP
jgi:hypothetical protein